MLIGYLNTSDNSINQQINNSSFIEPSSQIDISPNTNNEKQISGNSEIPKTNTAYAAAFNDVITNETDFHNYTPVISNRPGNSARPAVVADAAVTADKKPVDNNDKNVIQSMDTYIKSNKVFTDIAVADKKNKTNTVKQTAKNGNPNELSGDNTNDNINTIAGNKISSVKPVTTNTNENVLDRAADENKTAITKIVAVEKTDALTNEEKAWIENYALLNKASQKSWKDRFAYQFYTTPAVNYRKLSTKSKGSTYGIC